MGDILSAGKQVLRNQLGTANCSSRFPTGVVRDERRAHIFFLLDRSGSMHSIADDVIGGFNAFVKEQQDGSADTAGLDMTLVQFDTQDPREVLFAGRDISDVPLLCTSTFCPRGMTPLFDAIGNIIAMAEEAEASNQQMIIVTFSDGEENASREYSKSSVFERIRDKEKKGWTFVFLGANQDSYAQGGRLGFGKANIQNFAFDGKGTQTAWQAVRTATTSMRLKLQRKDDAGLMLQRKDFFEGTKVAEDDFKSR